MKAGKVVSIRVNPRDCQSVLDILDAVGIKRNALTYAQCVSLALGSLLETARKMNLIPEPDEFEYSNRMAPYAGKQGQRQRVAKALHDRGGSHRAAALAEPREDWPTEDVTPKAAVAPAARRELSPLEAANQRAAAQKFTDLLTKKEMAEDGVEGVTWGSSDQTEYDRLFTILYPNG